jgi:hypothetical protein
MAMKLSESQKAKMLLLGHGCLDCYHRKSDGYIGWCSVDYTRDEYDPHNGFCIDWKKD